MNDLLNALVLISNYVLIPSLSYGSQLALGALGVTLVFGILRFANFAHGEMMSFATMGTIFITWWLQSLGISAGFFPTALLALPFGILLTMLLVGITERSVFRFYRLRKSRPVIFVIASVGVMFMLNGIVRLFIGTDEIIFRDGQKFLIKAGEFKKMTGLGQGLALKQTQLLTVVLAVLAVAALFWFLQHTRTGKAMRGFIVAFSEVSATYAFKKFLKYLLPSEMAPQGLMQFLSTEYKFAVSFLILVLVLLVRPTGIFRGRVL